MGIIIDLVLIFILVLCVLIGRIRGLIRTVMGLVSFAVSAVVSVLFTPVAAQWMFDSFKHFFSDRIFAFLTDQMQNSAPADFFASLPESVTGLIGHFGVSSADVSQQYSEQAFAHGSEQAIHSVSDFIADPIASLASRVIAFFAIFIIAMILCKLAFRLLDKVAKLPVLNTANRIGGMLIGLLFGIGWVWILCVALNLLSPTLAVTYPDLFSAQTIHESMIFNFVSDHLPLGFVR